MKYTSIETNGQVLPVAFGMGALASFLDEEDININDIAERLGKDLKLSQALKIVWYSLRDGHRLAGKDFTMTYEDACDLVTEDSTLMEKCMSVFSASMPQGSEGNGAAPAKKPRR